MTTPKQNKHSRKFQNFGVYFLFCTLQGKFSFWLLLPSKLELLMNINFNEYDENVTFEFSQRGHKI